MAKLANQGRNIKERIENEAKISHLFIDLGLSLKYQG